MIVKDSNELLTEKELKCKTSAHTKSKGIISTVQDERLLSALN